MPCTPNPLLATPNGGHCICVESVNQAIVAWRPCIRWTITVSAFRTGPADPPAWRIVGGRVAMTSAPHPPAREDIRTDGNISPGISCS